MKIRVINRSETFDLRHRVLRPTQPLTSVEFKEDLRPGTFHLGAVHEGSILGIATFTPEATPAVLPNSMNPFRLRGMAVEPSLKRQGVGRNLLTFAEQKLVHLGCDLLWFNARESAFDFYANLNFQFIGDLFEIETVGLHKVMYKTL
jgi:GNAT superfamily N-acetyltransferase